MDYPRVVILSMTDISSSSATGSLIRELFADFPSDHIFQITAQVSQDETSRRYLNRCGVSTSNLWVHLCKRIWPMKGVLKTFGAPQSSLLNKISSFKPDLIYLRIVDNLYTYRELAELISEEFAIPIVTHIMDDYESVLAYSPNLYKRLVSRFFLRKDLNFLFGVAKLNFAISNSMSSTFEDKYGYKFEVFHNGIDPVEWKASVEANQNILASEKTHTSFRLVMAGSIDKQKDADVITQVCRVVHFLNKSGDLDCELILNVPVYFYPLATSLAESHLGVRAQQYQPLKDYRKLLLAADCLILARNSDETTRAYTGLSFHNKLPEYLASGTLVLCIGPEWDGSVQFLKNAHCGVVISTTTDSGIRENILSIAKHPMRYRDQSARAKKVAVENFDIRLIRKRFRQRLCEVARTPYT